MWINEKSLSLLIKLNAPNTVISGYSKIMMNIFIEKSSNYRTFRFSSFNHIFENGVNGITKEAGGFANRVLPAGSRKWNSVSIFFKNPSRLVATTQVAYRADDKLVRPARWKSWNTYEYAEIYIYICISVVVSEQRCAIGSGNGFLPLRRTLLYFTDSRRFSPRNATTFLLSTYSWCLSRASMYTRQTRLSCRWENFNRVERILEWVIGRYKKEKRKKKRRKRLCHDRKSMVITLKKIEVSCLHVNETNELDVYWKVSKKKKKKENVSYYLCAM